MVVAALVAASLMAMPMSRLRPERRSRTKPVHIQMAALKRGRAAAITLARQGATAHAWRWFGVNIKV